MGDNTFLIWAAAGFIALVTGCSGFFYYITHKDSNGKQEPASSVECRAMGNFDLRTGNFDVYITKCTIKQIGTK